MYQQTTVLGYVGNEPVMRYTESGIPVTNFNVAVNNRFTNAAGDGKDETIWYRVTTWQRLAETCAQYVDKGQLVLVVGQMKNPTAWLDQDEQPRAALELTARIVKFMPSGQPSDDEVTEAVADEEAA